MELSSFGTGSMGSVGGLSGSSSFFFNKFLDLIIDVISLSYSLVFSLVSVYFFILGGFVWVVNLSSFFVGSKDILSY